MALLYFVDTIIHYIRHKSKHFNPHFFKTTNQSLTNITKLASENIKDKTTDAIVFSEPYSNYKQILIRVNCNDSRGQQSAALYPHINVNGFTLNWALDGDFSTYSYKIEGYLQNGNTLALSTIRRGSSITEFSVDIYGITQY